jgi:CBS domain-containing protein
MKAGDLLKTKGSSVITIGAGATLKAAADLLRKHHIGVLLVTDAAGKAIGILSERDIVRVFSEQGDGCGGMLVRNAMTEDLIVAVPEDDLDYVMNVMTQKRIRHLPVMEGDDLKGLISIGDVVKAQIDFAETEIRYLRSYITGMPT